MSQHIPPQSNEKDSVWFDRPLLRLLFLTTIYLLGVIAVSILQAKQPQSFIVVLPIILFCLPLGFAEGVFQIIPSIRVLLERIHAVPMSFLLGVGMFFAPIIGIMIARTRWMLILSYIGFIIAVLIAVQGCSTLSSR